MKFLVKQLKVSVQLLNQFRLVRNLVMSVKQMLDLINVVFFGRIIVCFLKLFIVLIISKLGVKTILLKK